MLTISKNELGLELITTKETIETRRLSLPEVLHPESIIRNAWMGPAGAALDRRGTKRICRGTVWHPILDNIHQQPYTCTWWLLTARSVVIETVHNLAEVNLDTMKFNVNWGSGNHTNLNPRTTICERYETSLFMHVWKAHEHQTVRQCI